MQINGALKTLSGLLIANTVLGQELMAAFRSQRGDMLLSAALNQYAWDISGYFSLPGSL
jgi:hypothetical protein